MKMKNKIYQNHARKVKNIWNKRIKSVSITLGGIGTVPKTTKWKLDSKNPKEDA